MTLKCHPSSSQCQQVLLAVTIVILCTQLQVAEMTRKSTQQAQPKAQWNSFLKYLISVKSAMAGTSFKKVTFNETAKYIESLRTVRPVKTGAHSWANIEGPATEAVWEEYVSRKPNFPMKSFKNCGWPYHSKMEEILPHHSSARGVAAYNPASASNEPPPAASIIIHEPSITSLLKRHYYSTFALGDVDPVYIQAYTMDKAFIQQLDSGWHELAMSGKQLMEGTPPEYMKNIHALYFDVQENHDYVARIELRLLIRIGGNGNWSIC
ncbi:hypothetical protein BDR05DRAFT_950967 [Suillus weaverae]|nr:hypothetical protein BDR05DRAFT_950967 [Suillus weaverae]